MKLGLVTSILDGWNFEEVLKNASQFGYECIEVACWPQGDAQRRYAGVSHIDVSAMTLTQAQRIKEQCTGYGIQISALAFYPNPLDHDLGKAQAAISHLYKVIDAASMLGVNLVTTFIGRDQTLTVEENLELFTRTWQPIVAYAQEKGVRIAIENCPMLFGPDQWPGGQNLATTPEIWREMFARISSGWPRSSAHGHTAR